MADSVTQLQNQINTLCQLMFNYAGTLQRDAKPVRRPTRSTARKTRDAARELSPVRHD
jgi:mediator of RNA polymerase II transcription subunit 21